jgi:hypothetical protein
VRFVAWGDDHNGAALDAEAALAAAAWRYCGPEGYEPYLRHPACGAQARATLNNWLVIPERGSSLRGSIRDIAHWAAAEKAMVLAAQPEGLTAATLARLLRKLKLASRGRARATLIYLQYLRLIEVIPESGPEPGPAGERRYRPTQALQAFMNGRFRRDLEEMVPIEPLAGQVLARWEEPGVFERFMAAGEAMTVAVIHYKPDETISLDALVERNAGMSLIGQILLTDDPGEVWPPRGPVRLNVMDLARRSGAPRHQVNHLIKLARQEGFLIPQPDGTTAFGQGFPDRVARLVAMYWRTLAWRAGEALA